MRSEFGEEDFAVTLTMLSTVLIMFFLTFQVLSTPRQRYLAIYAVSEEGSVLNANATKLHIGDDLKVKIVLENHMGEMVRVKLEVIVAGTLSPEPRDGSSVFRLQEQELSIDDDGISASMTTLAVTRARFEEGLVVVEEFEVNGARYLTSVESPLENQTLRLIFRVLVWSDLEGRYLPQRGVGLDSSSWLQVWFELLPEDDT